MSINSKRLDTDFIVTYERNTIISALSFDYRVIPFNTSKIVKILKRPFTGYAPCRVQPEMNTSM